MADKKNLHFKTNVQLKSIIGKDLINDDNIAILELVKNSFDADSKKVEINFLNLKLNDDNSTTSYSKNTSRIIIRDNGLGMDLSDITDKWLNIAYSEKKSNTKQHNRRMAGAKGVGRFSCDRLGEYLNLYAKTENISEYIKLSIDWKKFEIEDEKKEIQSILLDYEKITEKDLLNSGLKPFNSGVLLEIIKLRSNWIYKKLDKEEKIVDWNTDKLIQLKKYLEKLINPSQQFQNDDFGVYINAPELISENKQKNDYEKFLGKVENRIFDKLDFKSTSIECKTLENGKILFTELKDKGETIFWLKEKNIFYPEIKDFKITLYYLNPYAKAFFTRQTGIKSVNYGSIFLFINGFRIPPYGEPGNDWLGLDMRKAQGYSRNIGSREIIGQIEIIDESNDFQIISSREGIVNNENYRKLISSEKNDSLFFKSFRRLEKYVVVGLNWDSSIYDNKDPRLREIESKIISGETSEDELEYREDNKVKQLRIYSIIHSIVSANHKDVIELYINENLITQKVEEEKEKSEKEFEQLLNDFDSKKIDTDTLNRILEQKAIKNKELEKQLREFAKYSTSEVTTKALLELQNYKKTIEDQTQLIEKLKQELENLKGEKQKTETTAKVYKERAEKAEKELKTEKEKSLYLLSTRRTLSEDADGLIHTIKINNVEVRDGLDIIIDDLIDNNFTVDELVKRLTYIRLNAERSLKMAEIATRSSLKEDIEKRDINIVKYIQEYVSIYGETFSETIEFFFEINNSQLIKNLSVLNLSIILDNLISNAVKWNANKVLFKFKNIENNKLSLIISDNGNGLVDEYLKDSDKIFELSVRAQSPKGLSGSGIGLFYSKQLLNDMNSEIRFIGNNLDLSGASFEIIFKSI